MADGHNYALFHERAPQYKYVLNLNAVTSSWRLHELLLSGSVLMLQEHPVVEWLQMHLQPWIHYVPLAEDLSDLIERIEWLRANDEHARLLAEAALHVGQQLASDQAVWCFFVRALRALRALPRDQQLFANESVLRRKGYRRRQEIWPLGDRYGPRVEAHDASWGDRARYQGQAASSNGQNRPREEL